MAMKRFMRAAVVVGFAALSLSRVKAQAQSGGLVNRAKKAAHLDEAVKPANRRDGLLTVTSARIGAYIRRSQAEHLGGVFRSPNRAGEDRHWEIRHWK